MARRVTVPNNEGKCLDAVLRVVERREGSARRNISFPENDGHSAPVELTCDIGGRLFAVEHTRIESFSKQISDEVKFGNLTKPIVGDLQGCLPTTAQFDLIIQIGALDRVKNHQVPAVRKSLSAWIRSTARRLSESRAEWLCTEHPKGVPFEVTLACKRNSPSLFGRIGARRWAPAENNQERLRAMRRALDEKLPKLQMWKDNGATSVLVLEDWDAALSNTQTIVWGVRTALPSYNNPPDEIYCVDTSGTTLGGTLWIVSVVKRNSEFPPYSQAGILEETEFEASNLFDIT